MYRYGISFAFKKEMKFQYFIIIFLIGFYFKSHAELKLKITNWKDASTLAQRFPILLINNGIEHIGNLNLNELAQKINDKNEITFISIFDLNNKLFIGGSWVNPTNDLDRIGAECYTSEATKEHFYNPIKQIGSKRFVNINKLSPLFQNLDPYYLQFVLLHESLCSLFGFSVDDQYQITSSIAFILGLLKTPDQLDKYLSNNKWNFLEPFVKIKSIASHRSLKVLNQKIRRPADSGGITVGPGGGDPWSPYFKFILMNILHGKEIYCEKQENQYALRNLSCKDFIKKMQLYWDKLRQLNIETEMPLLSIKVLDQDYPLNPFRIKNNFDSSISLVINRADLNELELKFKDRPPLDKPKYHISFISEALSELITQWSNGK